MTADKDSQDKIDPGVDPVPRRRGKHKKSWTAVGLRLAFVCVALLLAGAMFGYLVAGLRTGAPSETVSAETEAVTWTCSMHPAVQLPQPGLCPICNMDLVPLDDDPSGPRELKMSRAAMALAEIQVQPVKRQYVSRRVRMVGHVDPDETRMAEINAWVGGRLDRLFVNYTGITVRKGDHLVSLYSPDLVVAQRELLQTWQAYRRAGTPQDKQLAAATLKSAEEKLRLLGLLDEQIAEIKRRGAPSDHLTIYAPVGGIVTKKHANEGTYVKTGTKIYSITDLSRVWVYLDAYESDIPWLRYGQVAEFTTESFPGEVFQGTVVFIDPVLNEKTRTTRVRLNVPNEDLRLKPGMLVRAVVHSELGEGDRVLGPSLAGKWISPMHPEIVKDGPGKCDVCGMDLVPAEELGLGTTPDVPQPPLVIPATAPLITGKRAVVYVRVPTSADLFKEITTVWKAAVRPSGGEKPTAEELLAAIETGREQAGKLKAWREAAEIPLPPDKQESNFDGLFRVIENLGNEAAELSKDGTPSVDRLVEAVKTAWQDAGRLSDWERPSFDGREIVLGQRAGDYYIVRRGLEEGQQVVTSGSFKIDSALQIQAKPSMMSATGLVVPDEFRRQLAALYGPYLELHEALADDRFDDALPAWHAVRKAVEVIPSDTLDERLGKAWQTIQGRLQRSLAADVEPDDIEALRRQFEPLAMAMLRLVETFGHTQPGPLYEAHCPMAFNFKGASWLQAGRKIANPYFGHKMLTCGSIKRSWATAAQPNVEEDSP